MTPHRESQSRATTGMQRHSCNKCHFAHTHTNAACTTRLGVAADHTHRSSSPNVTVTRDVSSRRALLLKGCETGSATRGVCAELCGCSRQGCCVVDGVPYVEGRIRVSGVPVL